MEGSPSGLWRTLGKRVGRKPSRVRIPLPPPNIISQLVWVIIFGRCNDDSNDNSKSAVGRPLALIGFTWQKYLSFAVKVESLSLRHVKTLYCTFIFYDKIIEMKIVHKIPIITQSSSSNCVQTSTSQFLDFYSLNIFPADIEKAVPVRNNKMGKPMGTLFADIGTWLIQSYNIKVTMHVFDVQIVDRTWALLSQQDLLEEMLKIRESGVSTAHTPYASILIDSYISLLQAGGKINITKCTNKLLQNLLIKGPVLAIINFNYMYDYPRSKYDTVLKSYVADSADGKAIEHAILITGFEDGKYFYNDPDPEKGGKHVVKDDILIGAICTAQLNSDNYLLTIET